MVEGRLMEAQRRTVAQRRTAVRRHMAVRRRMAVRRPTEVPEGTRGMQGLAQSCPTILVAATPGTQDRRLLIGTRRTRGTQPAVAGLPAPTTHGARTQREAQPRPRIHFRRRETRMGGVAVGTIPPLARRRRLPPRVRMPGDPGPAETVALHTAPRLLPPMERQRRQRPMVRRRQRRTEHPLRDRTGPRRLLHMGEAHRRPQPCRMAHRRRTESLLLLGRLCISNRRLRP